MYFSVEVLVKLFLQPFNKFNVSLRNIKNSILLFTLTSVGPKYLDLVHTQLELSFNVQKDKSIHFNFLIEQLKAVKHVFQCTIIYISSLTSPITVASNERTLSKPKLVKLFQIYNV